MYQKIFIFLLLFSCKNISVAQNNPISNQAIISVITVGVADESHSLYGHTALRVQDPILGTDLVYNYGMFDFSTPNFVAKFAKGDLQYYAAAYPYPDFEYSYQLDNRSIFEQVLNLTYPEKQKLVQLLNTSLKEENKFYTYKFIDRNCTTKVIDIVNLALQDKPIVKKNSTSKTYREVLYPYAANHFYQELGINIIFGIKSDSRDTTIFLPFDLLQNLKTAVHNKKELAQGTKTLFKAISIKKEFSFLDSIYSLLTVLTIIVLVNNKVVTHFYFLVLGLIGVLFSFMGIYSYHQELYWNYNILLFNPLLLILLYFIFRKNIYWTARLSQICLILILIYTIFILNKPYFRMVFPIIVATFILLYRNFKTAKTTALYKTQ